MKENQFPFVSIIIVNFNGKTHLERCLTSLKKITYPKSRFEIIIVDNNSHDNSVTFIKNNYPYVQLIQSKENLGFAGGNNLGVSKAQGEYVVLLNNDTWVDENWLQALVTRAESDPQIAAVNSKSHLSFPCIPLTITSDVHSRSEFTHALDFQSVGVLVEDLIIDDPQLQRQIHYQKGFYDVEKGEVAMRWTKGKGVILVPADTNKKKLEFLITIRAQKSTSHLKTHISILLGNQEIKKDVLDSYEVKQYHFSFPIKDFQKNLLYRVQNAGNVIFRSGHSRDRGAVVKKYNQIYEIDNAFYQESSDILAFCGVSVLLRKKMYQEFGGFDETFFMYYEDTDLSVKLRRAGYRLVFEPKSLVYHIHAGSSVEWSPFFIFHVERNHLAFVFRHFPLSVVIQQTLEFFAVFLIGIIKMIRWRIVQNWVAFEDFKERSDVRIKIIRWLIKDGFRMYFERMRLSKKERVKMMEIYLSCY